MHANQSRPPVGVVIVNWNLKDSLREPLLSFRKVNYPNLQIVVSDNASTDGAPDMVRAEFPEGHLLTREKGVGYAKGASVGMEFLADKTIYVFSTTNDVLVDECPHCLLMHITSAGIGTTPLITIWGGNAIT